MQTASQTPLATQGAIAPAAARGAVALSVVPPAVSRLFHAGVRPVAQNGRVNPDGTGPFITTLQAYGSDAKIYQVTTTPPARPWNASGPYLMYLSSFTTALNAPYGTSITPSGTWYIANSADLNVPVFTISGSGVVTGPIETLSDPVGIPVGVDANATGSLVAVSNNAGPSGGGPGSIALYADGSTTPTSTRGVAGSAFGIAVALDRGDNCYWSYNVNPSGGGSGVIVEFPKCRGKAKTIVTGIGWAGGLAFNQANDLFYTDQTGGTVNRCVGNTSCHVIASGFGDPFAITFDSGWKHLWLTDVSTNTIYALNKLTGAQLSANPAEGGGSDPPLGIAAAPGPQY